MRIICFSVTILVEDLLLSHIVAYAEGEIAPFCRKALSPLRQFVNFRGESPTATPRGDHNTVCVQEFVRKPEE